MMSRLPWHRPQVLREVQVTGRRAGIGGAQDVVRPVAVDARGRQRLALLAPLAVDAACVLLGLVGMAVRAVDGLERRRDAETR